VLAARHPTSHPDLLAHRQGHDLSVDLDSTGLASEVLTCRRLRHRSWPYDRTVRPH